MAHFPDLVRLSCLHNILQFTFETQKGVRAL